MKPEFKGKYAMCWFPYTLAEMKEFKKITLEYFNVIQNEGLVPSQSSILSKSVLETASGRRVWEMLRFLSDYALRLEIHKMSPDYCLPDFCMTLNEFKQDNIEDNPSDESKILAKKQPALSNINKTILGRNRIGAIVGIQKQVQKFKEVSKAQKKEKDGWIKSSIHLNDLYNETKESIAKYTQAIKEINLNPESALVNDALQRSLACIDRIPLMDSINENYDKIQQVKTQMENNNLKDNLQTLLEFKSDDIKNNCLSEDLMFKDLLDIQKDELKQKILANPEENKKVIAVDKLIDQANRQTSDVIDMIEKDKYALSFEELSEIIQLNIKSHSQKLNEIKQFNKTLEDKIAV